MSAATPTASIDNRHFLLRRLHSLLGVLPASGFVMFHLWENSQSRLGAAHYNQEVVGAIQGMNYLPFLEVFGIALPLLFHAAYGLVVALNAKSNVQRYGYLRNWMWWLQRVSGVGVLGFLALHVGGTRIYSIWHPEIVGRMFEHMQSLFSVPWILAVYALGLVLSVFHLANGLWTLGITWGITITPRSQRISQAVVAGLGLLILAFGVHGLLGFFLAGDAGTLPLAGLLR